MKVISLLMILFSGVFYQICSRSIPSKMNPIASLVIIYSCALGVALLLYFITSKGSGISGLLSEVKKANYAPFLLGMVLCMYELGYILAYRNGFKTNELSAICAISLMAILVFVGRFLYQESINWKIVLGISLAITGVIITKI